MPREELVERVGIAVPRTREQIDGAVGGRAGDVCAIHDG